MFPGFGFGGAFVPIPTAPVAQSATVPTGGTTLVITYSAALDTGSVPAAGDFALGNLGAVTVSSVGVSGSAVTLTLSGTVYQPDFSVTVSYTPGVNKIRGASGGDAVALSAYAVSNNSTQTLSAASLVSAITAAVTTKTIRGFFLADLGISQATTSGRVSSWANQIGAMATMATPSTTAEPVYNSSDSDFGGRASVQGNGTDQRMTNATNPPAPTTTPEHRLTVCYLTTWASNKTFGQAGSGRFGGRTGSKTSTYELVGNSGVGPQVDFYERRGTILEEYLAGGSTSRLRVGSAETAGVAKNDATGVAIETQDPASTALFANTAGTSIIAGKIAARLVTDGELTAGEVTKVRGLYRSYYGASAIQSRKLLRVSCIGASIMRNQGATNYDGDRKGLHDYARTNGYPLDFFGTTADGTQPDNQHSGVSGSDIADCTTRWNANYGATKQFNGWPDIVILSIGAADILNGTSGATAADAYATLVQLMLTSEPGIKMMVVRTECPINGTSGQNAEMAAFNNALRNPGGKWDQLATANPGVIFARADYYAALGEVYAPVDFVTGENHPNDSGYAKLTPVLIAAMAPYLPTLSLYT